VRVNQLANFVSRLGEADANRVFNRLSPEREAAAIAAQQRALEIMQDHEALDLAYDEARNEVLAKFNASRIFENARFSCRKAIKNAVLYATIAEALKPILNAQTLSDLRYPLYGFEGKTQAA
jgi:hypothetical protein